MGEVKQRQQAATEKKPAGPGKKHPLAGAGLHYKDEHERVLNQAMIVEVIPSNSAVGDLALIQYFEWFIGAPSTRRLIPLSELASSDRWVFYSSVDEMNDHYERVDGHRSEAIRKRLEKEKGRGE